MGQRFFLAFNTLTPYLDDLLTVDKLSTFSLKRRIGPLPSPCSTFPRNGGWIRQWTARVHSRASSNYATVIYANCNYTACTVSADCTMHPPYSRCPAWRTAEFRQLSANLLNSNLTGSHLPPLVPPYTLYPLPQVNRINSATNWIISPRHYLRPVPTILKLPVSFHPLPSRTKRERRSVGRFVAVRSNIIFGGWKDGKVMEKVLEKG